LVSENRLKLANMTASHETSTTRNGTGIVAPAYVLVLLNKCG
jgi:hypothetical protein